MRGSAARDGLKLWLFFAGCVAGASWISPWLYNAGMALAEVTEQKNTNPPLDALAAWCRASNFSEYYLAGLWIVAALLSLPMFKWLRSGAAGGSGSQAGQPLEPGSRDLYHAAVGFVSAALILHLIGWVLVSSGFWVWQRSGALRWHSLFGTAWGLAVIQEAAFRGLALGFFLRGWRPSLAIFQAALMFMLAHSLMPNGLAVPDPEQSGVGFEMLGMMLRRLGDFHFWLESALAWLLLGLTLGSVRWRTASLALPIGIHAGWIFSSTFFEASAAPVNRSGMLAGQTPSEGWLGMAALMILCAIVSNLKTVTPNACLS